MAHVKTVPVNGAKVVLASTDFHHKPMDIAKMAQEIQTSTGLVIGSGAESNGYIHLYRKPAGEPFSVVTQNGVRTENDECPKCETQIPRAQEHWCNEVVLYDEDRVATDTPLRAAVQLRKHSLDASGLARLRKTIEDHKA